MVGVALTMNSNSIRRDVLFFSTGTLFARRWLKNSAGIFKLFTISNCRAVFWNGYKGMAGRESWCAALQQCLEKNFLQEIVRLGDTSGPLREESSNLFLVLPPCLVVAGVCWR